MTISSLNRSSFSNPVSRTSNAETVSAPAQSVESTPEVQPQNDLRQMFMADSFEAGPSKVGGAAGGAQAGAAEGPAAMMNQMAQMLGQIMQMLQAMNSQMQGGQGGASGEGQQGQAAAPVGGAGGAQGAAPTAPSAPAEQAAAAPAAAAPAAPAPAAAAAPAEAPAPTAAPSADVSNKSQASAPTSSLAPDKATGPGSSAGPGFGAPSAGSNDKVDPSTPWLAKNNVGSPYNSNMQVIDPSQKSQFKYTNTFTNKTDKPQTVTLWNKTGEDGGPNSGQSFDKSTPKTFTLQPGQSATVAFDNNSSVAWAVSKDGSSKAGANSGQTWGEASFGNAATGWSGYDTSQIAPAGHNGSMSITNDATGKTVTEKDAWQTPSDNPAGHDVGVPAGPLNLTTTLG